MPSDALRPAASSDILGGMGLKDLPTSDRRAWYAAGFLVTLLTMAALRQLWKPEGGLTLGRPVEGGTLFPSEPKVGMPEPGAKGGARSGLDLAGGGAGAKTELDQLLNLLSETQDEPVARKFAAEFKAEPKLNQAFEDYKREVAEAKAEGREPTSVRAFARGLGEMTEFRRLVARFASEPGFRGVGASLLAMPQLKAAVYEQTELIKAAVRARGRKGFVAQASRRGGGSQRTSAFTAAGPRRGSETGGGASVQGAGRSATPAGAGGFALAGADVPQATKPAGGGAGPDAHEVGGLNGIGGAGGGRDAAAAFVSLCYRGDPSITKAQCAAIEEHLGDHDLWESCVKAGLYQKCSELCRTKKELKCGPVPSFYDTCVSAGESNCAARCRQVPGCTPPAPPPSTASPGGSPGGTPGGSTTGSSTADEPPVDPRAAACRARSDEKKDCWWIGYKCCCLFYIFSGGKIVGSTGTMGCPQ